MARKVNLRYHRLINYSIVCCTSIRLFVCAILFSVFHFLLETDFKQFATYLSVFTIPHTLVGLVGERKMRADNFQLNFAHTD